MSMRICLVDDDAMVRDAVTLILRTYGHDVFSASTAAEAIEIVDAEQPEFVVTDYNLAEMHGDVLAAELRARHPHVCIIVTSGAPLPSGAATSGGGDLFLTKPFTPAILLAALERVRMTRKAVTQ